jgi:hypothetical protein
MEDAMPTNLPRPDPDEPVKMPKKHVQIDHDVILPTPRPSDEPDVELPGDAEGGHRGPPQTVPVPGS